MCKFIVEIDSNTSHYQVVEMRGTEQLSGDCEFVVTIECHPDERASFVLGSHISLSNISVDNAISVRNFTIFQITEQKISLDLMQLTLTVKPRLQLLSELSHSRVIIDTSLQLVLLQLLNEAGYTDAQVDWRLSNPLPNTEMFIQAMESHLALFHRLLSQYGLFYWFESDNENETVVIADSNLTSPYIRRGLSEVVLRDGLNHVETGSGGSANFVGFSHASLHGQMHANTAMSLMPGQQHEGNQPTDCNYFEPVAESTAQAAQQAKQQTNALHAHAEMIYLTGNVPEIFAGCSFSLLDNAGTGVSGDYLCIHVSHTLSQQNQSGQDARHTRYANKVTCIARNKPFKLKRPAISPKPVAFAATVESLSRSAMLDDSGRYRIRTAFDNEARPHTQSSSALAQLTLYACANQNQATGWHFPLVEQSKVLIGCVNNDPNKAYILGFADSQLQPSVVTNAQQYLNRIVSLSHSELCFDDDPNVPKIILKTLDREHFIELNATRSGRHFVHWLSQLGSISLHAARALFVTSDNDDITLVSERDTTIDSEKNIQLTSQNAAIGLCSTMHIDANATHIVSQSNGSTSFVSRQPERLLCNDQLQFTSRQGDLTLSAPNGSALIKSRNHIRIEGRGNGAIRLHNAGGEIKLSRTGDVEIIATQLITLKGALTRFDGPVDYNFTAPSRANMPSVSRLSPISRTTPINPKTVTARNSTAQTLRIEYRYQDGSPVENAPYTILFDEGTELSGALDSSGVCELQNQPVGRYQVILGEDTRVYDPTVTGQANPLFGQLPVATAIALGEQQINDKQPVGLFDQAMAIANQAGEWTWGTLHGDFNQNPSTSQIVVGSIISMIPFVDQAMDVRDIIANVMLLTDDDKANDNSGWLGLALTGIGLVPVLGSAIKGVGKVILKHSDSSLDAALAVMRKISKGDPVAYLRQLDWNNLGRDAAKQVKELIKTTINALDGIRNSTVYRTLLPSTTLNNLSEVSTKLKTIMPKVEQGIMNATRTIRDQVNSALAKYNGPQPVEGIVGQPNLVKAKEADAPTGNQMPGVSVVKHARNPILDRHYRNLADYAARYKKKLEDAIKNGDSSRRIGAFKAKLTEVKGERAASAYMTKHFSKPPPPAQMELGFGPGPGFDQIWAKRDQNGNVLEYFIVEAKGPGAKLTDTSTKGFQMTDRWIGKTLENMESSKKYPQQNQLGRDILDADDLDIPIRKLVIEAIEENGAIVGGKLQPLPN